MATHLNSPFTTDDGKTYQRVQFAHLREHQTLFQRKDDTFSELGTIVALERDQAGTSRVTLDNGKNLTRKGWASKRLWRLTDQSFIIAANISE